MTLYDINLGDFSGDGHDKTEVFYLEIADSVAKAQLRANYIANCDLFGFSPSDFASEYEDNKLPAAFYDTLIENGYQNVRDTANFDEYDEEVIDTSAAERAENGDYYLNVAKMFKIVAFYLTHQPDGDIPWRRFRVQSKTLIGWDGVNYDRPGKEYTYGVGYGLFY